MPQTLLDSNIPLLIIILFVGFFLVGGGIIKLGVNTAFILNLKPHTSSKVNKTATARNMIVLISPHLIAYVY